MSISFLFWLKLGSCLVSTASTKKIKATFFTSLDVLRQFLYIMNRHEVSAELSEHAVTTHSFSFCLFFTPGTLHQRGRFEILWDKISIAGVSLSALSL